MKRSLFIEATQIAKKKLSKHPQGTYSHYSFIVQKNELVGYGINQDGEPLVHWGYNKNKEDPTYSPKIHSEIHAFRKNKALLKKNQSFEIINIRLNRKGELRLSKPCKCCNYLLSELGCKKFYYSCETGFLVNA
jgi:tRNA(Arg) A34 adenosine deaminase TadA